ncbi:MAG: hypothetical protein K9I59_09780 [Chlorobium sp.]|jgi:hypothetical protein|uniref:hypothetical protein n=1 Tax=Chlorobium sp. TaxID=1095 RepID=UPI001D9ED5E4|nr:hypothetical protein [Chlorobium sp.]MBN1279019.1 hypothetical protein [Chlorobiaceae bacterium]MCF8217108.1 hypothetical protein [Chlorobium sp.]MCF8271954.1 hypothetical protein [Chlorobium sp.]MCF8288325.1 hypothetical protein [Chlorobium sp.]MCF8291930.1 hypothetical protein [Chlorobium sp.]
MLSSLSKLTPEQIAEIRILEQDLGITLLSFSDYDVIAGGLAAEELARVRALEKKIGTVLIALDSASSEQS